MKIPAYWAKTTGTAQGPGLRYALSCWQWSDISVDDARQRASARLDQLVRKVQSGGPLNRYGYGEQPLREETTQKVTNAGGKEIGVVTRNLYGALVLNAANAMFIDIDFANQDGAGKPTGILQRLRGGAAPSQEDVYRRQVTAWADQHKDFGVRVYRTYGGLRCLITNQVFDPGQVEALDVLQALKSDPLYVRLCKAQACFRARLTPKPWRCGMDQPPSRYPWDNTSAEMGYRQWEQRYERAVTPYAACRLVAQLGPSDVHPDVEPILALHDKMACGTAGQTLA